MAALEREGCVRLRRCGGGAGLRRPRSRNDGMQSRSRLIATMQIGMLEALPMGLEEQLCLLLARWQLSPEAEQELRRLLVSPIRWDRALVLIRLHEILPLAYRNLKQLGFPNVPQPVRDDLAGIFRSNAMRNTLFADELARVLSLFDAAQVPVMSVKGIALAESLYGDSALRICADIDLLVAPENFAAAFRQLEGCGYTADFSEPRLVSPLGRYGKDCGLMRQDGAYWYPMQLHAGLFWGGPTELSIAREIWGDARRISFREISTYSLSAEWEFLYLAVHAARHGCFPLKFLVDLDRLCRSETIGWEKVGEKIGLLGWQRAVDSALSACADLLETPIPAALSRHWTRERAAPPRSASLPSEPSSLHTGRETLFSLQLIQSPSQKLRFLLVRTFIPTAADCRWLRLPSSLFFLYYVLRPLRLIFTMAGWIVETGRNKRREKLRGVAATG